MTAAFGSLDRPGWARLPRGVRRFLAGVAAGILCVTAAAGAITVFTGKPRSAPPPAQPAEISEVKRFTEQVMNVVTVGGAAVVYGMRPGISDISDGRYPQETLVRMAQGWLAEIQRASDSLASLPTAPRISAAAEPLNEAMARYTDTAEALVAAAQAAGDERSAHVKRAARLGTEADQLFTRAIAELDRLRARFGLPAADLTGGPPR